jgi:hypothetical protein
MVVLVWLHQCFSREPRWPPTAGGETRERDGSGPRPEPILSRWVFVFLPPPVSHDDPSRYSRGGCWFFSLPPSRTIPAADRCLVFEMCVVSCAFGL